MGAERELNCCLIYILVFKSLAIPVYILLYKFVYTSLWWWRRRQRYVLTILFELIIIVVFAAAAAAVVADVAADAIVAFVFSIHPSIHKSLSI